MADRTPSFTPHVEGPTHASTLFFVQGWPDDHTLWNDQVAAMRARYRCVRVDLPNYPDGEYKRWGFDHETIADGLAQCIRDVSPAKPVTLIGHDWGAYWAYLIHHRHPELVERLVGIDIAPTVAPTPREIALIVGYQWWLAAAFVVGGKVGDRMTQRMASLMRVPRPAAALRAGFNYPYFYTWRDVVSGRRSRQLRGYRPKVPVLYVYGESKPVRFHSDRWLEYVRSQPGSAVVPFAKTGHWVMRNPEFTRILSDWLDGGSARS